MTRVSRGIERLLDWVPSGLELEPLSALVEDDLVADDELAEVVGPGFPVHRSEIPRIRPILVALAARAAGAEQVDDQAQHAAELLHLALRVHDLALGREGGRRRRVARKLVRRSVEWLTGNQFSLRALELAHHGAPGVMEELLEALRSFADAQSLSRELMGQLPTEDDWLEHADGHTGALFAFCCRSGAQLAGAPVAQVSGLGRYGRHLGRMWHVAEDLAVLEQHQPALHFASRAAGGRPVLPVICAADRDATIGDLWTQLAAGAQVDLARELVRRVCGHGLASSREVLLRESWMARRALGPLPESRYRRGLEGLVAELTRAFVKPPHATQR